VAFAMRNASLQSQLLRGAVVLVLILAALGWEFGIKASRTKAQVWEGVITRTYKQRDWLRGLRKFNKPAYYYYDYYWEVKCADGRVRKAEVPHGTWQSGKAGLPVKKIAGRRYPVIDTPEAEQQRAIKQQVIDSAVDGVRKKVFGNE